MKSGEGWEGGKGGERGGKGGGVGWEKGDIWFGLDRKRWNQHRVVGFGWVGPERCWEHCSWGVYYQ